MNKVTFRVTFERDDRKPYPSDAAETPDVKFVDDPHDAAEIASEMANRPEGSGGSVIIGVWQLEGPMNYLVLVEPGDPIDLIEREIREKAGR